MLTSNVLFFSLPSRDDVDLAAVTADNVTGANESACDPNLVFSRIVGSVVRTSLPSLHNAIVAVADSPPAILPAEALGPAACEVAHADAATISVAQPTIPASAMQERKMGIVYVTVNISAEGLVTSSNIRKSSGWPDLDESARQAAMIWIGLSFPCAPGA